MGAIMSEFLNAQIEITDETVELRWEESDGRQFGLKMGHDMHDALERESTNQRTAVLMEALVYDTDDEGTYWSEL